MREEKHLYDVEDRGGRTVARIRKHKEQPLSYEANAAVVIWGIIALILLAGWLI